VAIHAFHLDRAVTDVKRVQLLEVVGDLGGYEQSVAGVEARDPLAGAAEILEPLLQLAIDLSDGRGKKVGVSCEKLFDTRQRHARLGKAS
jgi:hypothetical protein